MLGIKAITNIFQNIFFCIPFLGELYLADKPSLTFLNCMTRFMRLLVVEWACWAVPIDDCSRSSMEILFFRA